MNSAFHVYYHLGSKKLYSHTMIGGIGRVRQLHQSTHPTFMISCHRKSQDISIIILDPLSRIHTLYRVFFWEERPMRKGWSGPIFKVAKRCVMAKRCESIVLVPHNIHSAAAKNGKRIAAHKEAMNFFNETKDTYKSAWNRNVETEDQKDSARNGRTGTYPVIPSDIVTTKVNR